jgi:putative ABC transport system permease protein
MIRPRWQKVLSDLWRNKSRSLLTVASIAVGLLAIGVVTSLYFMMNQDMSAGFYAIHPANIQIQTGLFDNSLVKHIERMDGVQTVEPARETSLQILTTAGNWNPLDLQSKDFKNAAIGRLTVIEGTAIPGKNQIVLATNHLRDLDVEVGGYVSVQNSKGEIYQLQVVGIVEDQMIGTGGAAGGFFAADERGYVDDSTLGKLGVAMSKKYNTLYITVSGDAGDAAAIQVLGESIRADLEDNGYAISRFNTRDSYNHPNKDLVNTIVVILLMLTFLIVFLSGFLITNTLQFLMNQQIEQVGIMKSIGATQKKIILLYMALIAAFGLIAFAVAVPITNFLSDRLMVYMAEKVNFTYLGKRLSLPVLFIQITLAMIVPQLAALWPITRGTRISVQEALSGIQQQTESKEWGVERAIARLKSFTRPIKIALRNIFRNKVRLILTILTIALGGAVFISVFNVRVSFNKYIDQLSHYFLADLNITLSEPRRVSEVENVLYSSSEVGYVEAWSGARVPMIRADGSTGSDINIMAVPNQTTLVSPILIEGRWLDPRDQNAIALNDQFHNQFPGVKVGDTIRLKINDRESDWVVVGFFQMAGKLGGLIGYVNLDYFHSLPEMVDNKSAVYRVVAKEPLDAAGQKQMSIRIQSLLEQNGFDVSSIATGTRITESSTNGFNILTTVLLVLAVLIALVGSIGLAGTMSMNVMERTREIGVMRAIGASNRILMKMVMIEGLTIGMIGWVGGAILSFPISLILSNGITLALFGASSQLGYSITGFLIWLVVDVLLSVLASITPARSATRLTVREVLSYE